ncbi:MAG: winged helix-turn-helix domain-containing protein [Mediterranea sp.]|jgi:hypothetical protein|nr:winged helix-turn-helix domain-containing protein [Mediterranea sp.]
MNKKEISANAQKVWLLMGNNAHWTYSKLKEVSGLKDSELAAALGWLAKEDRIEFDPYSDEASMYLALNVYIC